MLTKPSIGVVVLTHNRPVGKIIDAWLPILNTNHDFIIVEAGSEVQYSSSADNPKRCLDAGVRYITTPNIGINTRCYGRNMGAEYVSGEYIAFVDGDCIPNASYLSDVEQTVCPNTVLCGNINYQMADGTIKGDYRQAFLGGRHLLVTHNFQLISEANMVVSRQQFEYCDGFDANWAANAWCGEGMDLYTRMFARFFTPLLVAGFAGVTHQYHVPSPEKLQAYENEDAFRERLYQNLVGSEHMHGINHPYMYYLHDLTGSSL